MLESVMGSPFVAKLTGHTALGVDFREGRFSGSKHWLVQSSESVTKIKSTDVRDALIPLKYFI